MFTLDSRTQWNSLLAMFEHFLKLGSAVSKVIIDKDVEEPLMNEEVDLINETQSRLNPIKTGIDKLFSQNASLLLTAEGVFTFIIEELQQK